MVLILVLAYKFLFPSIETKVETEIEYTKGDTVTVVEYDTLDVVHDTLIVFEAAEVYEDSTGHHASTSFDFFKDSVTVRGLVNYDEPNFSFDSLTVMYPKVEKTIVDTVTMTTTITRKPPIYKNEWFWSTIGAILVIISQL